MKKTLLVLVILFFSLNKASLVSAQDDVGDPLPDLVLTVASVDFQDNYYNQLEVVVTVLNDSSQSVAEVAPIIFNCEYGQFNSEIEIELGGSQSIRKLYILPVPEDQRATHQECTAQVLLREHKELDYDNNVALFEFQVPDYDLALEVANIRIIDDFTFTFDLKIFNFGYPLPEPAVFIVITPSDPNPLFMDEILLIQSDLPYEAIPQLEMKDEFRGRNIDLLFIVGPENQFDEPNFDNNYLGLVYTFPPPLATPTIEPTPTELPTPTETPTQELPTRVPTTVPPSTEEPILEQDRDDDFEAEEFESEFQAGPILLLLGLFGLGGGAIFVAVTFFTLRGIHRHNQRSRARKAMNNSSDPCAQYKGKYLSVSGPEINPAFRTIESLEVNFYSGDKLIRQYKVKKRTIKRLKRAFRSVRRLWVAKRFNIDQVPQGATDRLKGVCDEIARSLAIRNRSGLTPFLNFEIKRAEIEISLHLNECTNGVEKEIRKLWTRFLEFGLDQTNSFDIQLSSIADSQKQYEQILTEQIYDRVLQVILHPLYAEENGTL